MTYVGLETRTTPVIKGMEIRLVDRGSQRDIDA